MDEPTARQVWDFAGTASVVGVLMFFIRYFMLKEDRKDKFVARVIRANTRALRMLADAILQTDAGKHLDKRQLFSFEDIPEDVDEEYEDNNNKEKH